MRNKQLVTRENLQQMLEAIEQIEFFCSNASEQDFLEDVMLNSAVLLHFVIIGESVNKIDPDYLNQYDYPWFKVKSMRNLIAHQYHGITLNKIWLNVTDDLPTLKSVIQTMLTREFG